MDAPKNHPGDSPCPIVLPPLAARNGVVPWLPFRCDTHSRATYFGQRKMRTTQNSGSFPAIRALPQARCPCRRGRREAGRRRCENASPPGRQRRSTT